eukprot:365086-Chlamydomonas_euryale.AAC.2
MHSYGIVIQFERGAGPARYEFLQRGRQHWAYIGVWQPFSRDAWQPFQGDAWQPFQGDACTQEVFQF